MSTDIYLDMSTDICLDMRADVCLGMCADMCADNVSKHVYTHAYGACLLR